MTTGGAGSSTGAIAAAEDRLPPPDHVTTPWVEAYPPGVPPAYRFPHVGLTRLLDDAVRDFPATVATHGPDGSWTWAELHRQAGRVAVALHRLGVGTGTRVVLAAASPPVAMAVAFGTWRVGGMLVAAPPAGSLADRAWLMALAAPSVTVADPAEVDDGFHVDHAVVRISPTDLARPGRLSRRVAVRRRRHRRAADPGPTRPLRRGRGGVPEDPAVPDVEASPDGVALLMPVRDATGRRRLAALTHRQLVASVLQARLWIPDMQAGREVLLCPTSLRTSPGLVGGLLLATLAASTLVVPTPAPGPGLVRRRRGPAPSLLVADATDVDGLVTAADRGELDLASLRAGLVVGEQLSDTLATRLGDRSGQARVRRALGMPEAGLLTHANPVYGRADPALVGLPVTGTVAAVVDPVRPGGVLPDGRPGRLVVAGPQVMAGYWQDPVTSRAVLRDGWLLTDHLAVRDASGAFAIVGAVGDTVPQEATS